MRTLTRFSTAMAQTAGSTSRSTSLSSPTRASVSTSSTRGPTPPSSPTWSNGLSLSPRSLASNGTYRSNMLCANERTRTCSYNSEGYLIRDPAHPPRPRPPPVSFLPLLFFIECVSLYYFYLYIDQAPLEAQRHCQALHQCGHDQRTEAHQRHRSAPAPL